MPRIKKGKRRKPAKKAGPKSTLTPELSLRIKELVLKGFQYIKIQKELEIPAGTWDWWVWANHQGFAETLRVYNHEYMLKLAEGNLMNDLKMDVVEPVIGMFGPIFDKKTKKPVMKVNDKLLKIKNDTSTYITDTLGSEKYTKKIKTEEVGKQKFIILKETNNGSRKDDIPGTV